MITKRLKNFRIIPRLDIKNDTVIKGIHLEGLRVVGNPTELTQKYYNEGADEIIFMDAVASLYERNSLDLIVEKVAKKLFVPLTVGGGLRNLGDIEKVLRLGADKVAINTAAVRNPNLISEAANRFGSQCIVVSIDAKKKGDSWESYVDTGRESTNLDAINWAKEVVDLGAGELLITSIDREGTKKGFEEDLVEKIASKVPIPVIACGGAGSVDHVSSLYKKFPISAVACASIFHYNISSIADLKASMETE
ncbi:MAG: imidazole glycerol phosphate synthase cyclase subunit [bacterium]